MFIIHGTMETLTATDGKGRTFTQILSSVCKENGGAVDILEIDKFVFVKLRSRSRSGHVKVRQVRVRQSPAKKTQNSKIWT